MLVRSVATLSVLLLGGCAAGGAGSPRAVPEDDFEAPPPPDERTGPAPDAILGPELSPPPISGGSLALAGDLAVVGDPDLNAIHIASLADRAVLFTIELERGAEPGRIAVDGAGRAHVALRRAGDVVTIDPAEGAVIDRRHVCASPRGLAWRATDDTVVVACEEGALAFYPASGGAVSRRSVGGDLRDVVVAGDRLLVSKFRSAEVLVLDSSGAMLSTARPPSIEDALSALLGGLPEAGQLEPSVGWRMIPYRSGALLLHQRASTATLQTGESGYGGAFPCSSIVQTALAVVTADGTVESVSPALGDMPLAVDIAFDGASALAIAAPGQTFAQPRDEFTGETPLGPSTTRRNDLVGFPTSTLRSPSDAAVPGECGSPSFQPNQPGAGGSTVAVTWAAAHGWVSFARAPSRLFVVDASGTAGQEIALSPTMLESDGHRVFHSATAAGLACASCHAEGGDDGRVWNFAAIGPRRTQDMRGGILGTEPFHWDGDMVDLSMLLEHVFTGRMSGPSLDATQRGEFAAWVDAIPPLARPNGDAAAIERGRGLFETSGCTTCHAGTDLTSPGSFDVGTGGVFQVPSLAGIAYRAPYMHDGCAPTLEARLTDAACGGGDNHGQTSDLSASEVSDLVAYLRTL